MCSLCAAGSAGQDRFRRAQVLQLLSLVEHPDALPLDAALRVAGELLAVTGWERSPFRCDPLTPSSQPRDSLAQGET